MLNYLITFMGLLVFSKIDPSGPGPHHSRGF